MHTEFGKFVTYITNFTKQSCMSQPCVGTLGTLLAIVLGRQPRIGIMFGKCFAIQVAWSQDGVTAVLAYIASQQQQSVSHKQLQELALVNGTAHAAATLESTSTFLPSWWTVLT